jgi:hypothetical protein
MPLPSFNAKRMRPILIGVIAGRPSRFPSTCWARCRPAGTQSQIIALSNSSRTDNIPNKARSGAGVQRLVVQPLIDTMRLRFAR